VRANSKKNKIYFLKLKNEQIFTRSDELSERVNTTKTRSDVPSRREHRKATASGGGHFTYRESFLSAKQLTIYNLPVYNYSPRIFMTAIFVKFSLSNSKIKKAKMRKVFLPFIICLFNFYL
jgi:hypothetical protein